MKYGKIIDGAIRISDTQYLAESAICWLIDDGWKETILDNVPETDGFYGFKERYEELDDKIIVHYDIVEYDRHKVENQIRELKELLTASDYKIQKNIEFRDAGLELPYDPTDLHNERQPLRDRINELENLLTCVK